MGCANDGCARPCPLPIHPGDPYVGSALCIQGVRRLRADPGQPGAAGHSDYPAVFLADSTLVDRFPRGVANFAGQVRELRIISGDGRAGPRPMIPPSVES